MFSADYGNATNRVLTGGLRRWHFASCALSAWLLTVSLLAWGQNDKPADLPSRGIIGDVICTSDSAQSYALYLPSAYTPAKRWPIIYFFDPVGRGRRPLDLYKNIAETYGFIFAGSNNSRNFGGTPSASVNAIWQDTHLRISLDDRRVYSSGFSGGARVAGAMALGGNAGQITGVIAHGAGYPNSRNDTKDHLLYFFAIGNQDFNWPEVMTARSERENSGLPYRVKVFAGAHQWAPAAVMEEAVQWFMLKAMQSGDSAADTALVDRLLQQRQAEAEDAVKRKDVLAELAAYRSLASDFADLKTAKAAEAKLVVLKQSSELKAALKSERAQIAEQFALEREISPKLHAYIEGVTPDPDALRREILLAIHNLQNEAAHAKTESKRLIFGRAFRSIWVDGIESGQQELEAKHFEKAEICFDLMKQVSDDAWPLLLLAETHAAAGDRKRAIKDLQEAIRRGLKDPDVMAADPQLQVLNTDPEFQQLLAGLRGR